MELRLARLLAVVLLLLAAVLRPVAADKPKKATVEPAPPAEGASAGITREQADAILQELRQIRQLLEKQQQTNRPAAAAAPPTPPRVKLRANAKGHVLGRADAPVTLVEFTDFQCPFCQRYNNATFPELKKKYIDSGKVRYVGRDLPLDMHAQAFGAARAARCAGEQQKYWEMRQAIFADPKKLSPEDLLADARVLQIDVPAFQKCLGEDRVDTDIRADAAEAATLSITGTPTFVLGKTSKETVDGVLLVGAQPLAAFEAKIEELLQK